MSSRESTSDKIEKSSGEELLLLVEQSLQSTKEGLLGVRRGLEMIRLGANLSCCKAMGLHAGGTEWLRLAQ